MTVGLNKGTNSLGHPGWTRVKCRVCAMKLDITGQAPGARRIDLVYACPKCVKDYDAYFCRADAKALRYRCPFCKGPLKLITPPMEA